MNLNLQTPNQSFPPVEVSEVVLPTEMGEIVILPGHARLLSRLGEGTLTYRSASESKSFLISQGVVEVIQDQILVLGDSISPLGEKTST